MSAKNGSPVSHDKSDALQRIPPIGIPDLHDDAISHSLSILSTVYQYNHWIFDTIRDCLGSTIAEVGSGMGNISQFLLNAEKLVCIEPFAPFHTYLAERFSRHLNVSVCTDPIERCPNSDVPAEFFDSVICLNVLEHIEDDAGALVTMRELLAVGGRLVVLVPAMPWAFGSMDSAMGHFRRYSRKSLTALFRKSGLVVEKASYMNLPGLMGWLWHGRVLKRDKLSQASTQIFDKSVPFISAFERLVPVPVGQSLVVVGRRGAD